MNAFLISLFLVCIWLRILLKNCYTKKSVRCVCFLWWFHYCQDYPSKCEVWIAFFALSCLSTSMPITEAAHFQDIDEVRLWFSQLELRNCNAVLYSQSNYVAKCRNWTMYCYLLELGVAIYEEDVIDNGFLLPQFLNYFKPQNRLECPPCEEHEETSCTIFLQRFQEFLKKVTITESYHKKSI